MQMPTIRYLKALRSNQRCFHKIYYLTTSLLSPTRAFVYNINALPSIQLV